MYTGTFTCANDAYEFCIKQLSDSGKCVNIKNNITIEISPVLLCIEQPLCNHITNSERGWKKELAQKEFEWYMSGSNLVGDIERALPRWRDFSDNGITVNSAYGFLWAKQLPIFVNRLKNDKTSRQIVISLYDGNKFCDYTGKDTVCTETIQFLIRDNKLNCFVNMRSNDIIWGFCNDQFAFTSLQKYVAFIIGIDVGKYYHYTSNMHIYARHFKFLNKDRSDNDEQY